MRSKKRKLKNYQFNFWRKLVKLQHTPYLKMKFNEPFSMKILEIEAHFFFENWQFSTKISEDWWNWSSLLFWKLTIFDEHLWKLVKLRRTPFFKTSHFRRKFVKICEIEAHSLFENWQFSTNICEHLWNWGSLLVWKLTIFDEN